MNKKGNKETLLNAKKHWGFPSKRSYTSGNKWAVGHDIGVDFN